MMPVGPVTTLNRSILHVAAILCVDTVDLSSWRISILDGQRKSCLSVRNCENNNDLPFAVSDNRYWSSRWCVLGLEMFSRLSRFPAIPYWKCPIVPRPSKVMLRNATSSLSINKGSSPVRGLRSKSRPLIITSKLSMSIICYDRRPPISHLVSFTRLVNKMGYLSETVTRCRAWVSTSLIIL